MKLSTILITFLTALLVLATVCAAADKRPISHDDYDAWRQINGQAISWDGEWVLYLEVPGEGNGELVVQQIAGTKQYRHPVGHKPPRMPDASGEMPPPVTGASFTADSRHVVFLIRPTFEEQKAAKKTKDKDKNAPKNAVGILRLSDGDVATVPRVKSFKLPKEAGGWVAYLKEKGEEKEEEKEKAKSEVRRRDGGGGVGGEP
jgi:hypothetical protein